MERDYRLRPVLSRLRPYVAGRGIEEISRTYGIPPERIVKLGSNENPYGPSPAVRRAIAEAPLNLYPETVDLIESIARYTNFPEGQVLIGSGMDGVIDTLSRLFLDHGVRALIPTPTFSYYEIVTILCGADPVFVRRTEPGEMIERLRDKSIGMVFICSPNNPTGEVVDEELLRSIIESTDAVVFLDEAYVEFAERSMVDLVNEYENLVVGRTMSKAFGLAGVRLGYALAPEWIAEAYRMAAPPFFGVTTPAVAAGIAALSDLEHMRRSVEMIKRERELLLSEIVEASPSWGNFLYIETSERSDVITERMLRKGIIVRDCRSFRDAGDHHIRVTVGTPEQNARFLEAYREICG
ncbi:MAG: histidinol-phosphate transaminase [Methanothrix sp.]|uniref:Histidinol-phosphate aminotransferase n=1 Tax=Methanothrix thermoacetophila (strain DSM 6194 / JCM 14653 / NBRC 101360 / PT) TaxID=349307 RepID=A0B5Y3_METTP|nr:MULTISPECIES: histidinol-phosphate transaminase [Methanothrix]ABK14107.1 histidinol phosphate aminotransferase apoenzyme [Methanothrix thermoacetophila PT]MBC7079788.1 histidinol-phosphate transaminase [Methanothrix sp.]NPU87865.1 histidinol-phosphate transaminase [Methanothrix sp.]